MQLVVKFEQFLYFPFFYFPPFPPQPSRTHKAKRNGGGSPPGSGSLALPLAASSSSSLSDCRCPSHSSGRHSTYFLFYSACRGGQSLHLRSRAPAGWPQSITSIALVSLCHGPISADADAVARVLPSFRAGRTNCLVPARRTHSVRRIACRRIWFILMAE